MFIEFLKSFQLFFSSAFKGNFKFISDHAKNMPWKKYFNMRINFDILKIHLS